MIPTSFGSGVASSVTEVPQDSLDSWNTSGFLKPSVQPSQGKGSRRLYSFADLLALRVVGALREMGVARRCLRPVIAHIRTRDAQTLFRGVFLVFRGDAVAEYRGEQLTAILGQSGPVVFVVNLEAVDAELKRRLSAEASA